MTYYSSYESTVCYYDEIFDTTFFGSFLFANHSLCGSGKDRCANSVVRLSPNDNWAANIWNQPGILFEGDKLQAEGGSPDIAPPYSKSDSFDGSNLVEGHKYQVQADITVTAQPIDGGAAIDELNVSDSEDLFIPRNE